MNKKLLILVLTTNLFGCASPMKEIDSQISNLPYTLGFKEKPVRKLSANALSELDNLLTQASSDKAVQSKIDDAKLNIENTISFDACNEDRQLLVKYTSPNSLFVTQASPIQLMPYHKDNTEQCLTILRVKDATISAEDVISFDVVYESSVTREIQSVQYQMSKQPSGEWLF